MPYSYVVFLDDRSIKWKIVPQVSHRKRVISLGLYHRNRWGCREFHWQSQGAWGTARGLRELVEYIEGHERLERRKGG